MGNTFSSNYLHSFTQCIRTSRRNFKRKTSQQLIDINHVNDGFLYDDSSDDDDDNNDEKIIFHKSKYNTF